MKASEMVTIKDNTSNKWLIYSRLSGELYKDNEGKGWETRQDAETAIKDLANNRAGVVWVKDNPLVWEQYMTWRRHRYELGTLGETDKGFMPYPTEEERKRYITDLARINGVVIPACAVDYVSSCKPRKR